MQWDLLNQNLKGPGLRNCVLKSPGDSAEETTAFDCLLPRDFLKSKEDGTKDAHNSQSQN